MNVKFIVMTTASLLIISGCAQKKIAEKKVESQIQEAPVQANVVETAKEFIMKSDKLSPEQKEKLMELQSKTSATSSSLKEELEKTKLVMIKTVLDPEMNEREFKILKKKISKLEKERLENGFKAITEARNIIKPKANPNNHEFYKSFMDHHIRELQLQY